MAPKTASPMLVKDSRATGGAGSCGGIALSLTLQRTADVRIPRLVRVSIERGLNNLDARIDRGRRPRHAQQRLARLPFGHRIERLEELHLVGGEQRDGKTIAIEQTVAGQRRKLRSGGQ